MVGEPLFFTTEIKNTRNEPVYLWASKDGERLDLYQFWVQGPGGACGNRWDDAGLAEPKQLQPGETYHEQWPLDHFYRLGREGKYDVTISHKLRVSSATTGVQDFSFSSKFQLKLVAADSDAVQKTIQGFERDLNSGDPEVEHAALDTMATIAPSYFLPQIMRIAHDKDPFRVMHAIAALRQMNIPEGRSVLADIITSRETSNQDEISVRFHAIQALGESGDLAYLPLVQRYTGDKINDIQLESMIAVTQLGKEATTPEVQRFSLSADPATRKNAVYALRFAMNSQAVEALIEALADKGPEVRSRAATSLQEMTGHSESLSNNNGVVPGETQNRWRKWWRENHEGTHLIEPPSFFCHLN
jgi:HEAT repeats